MKLNIRSWTLVFLFCLVAAACSSTNKETVAPDQVMLQMAEKDFSRAKKLQAENKLPEAIIQYRDLIAGFKGKENQYVSQSLFQLALCYEALGEDEKNIASLVDLKARSAFLSEEVIKVEVPARLASAYARIGNEEEAIRYFNEAEDGLKKLRETNKGARPLWYGKIYFNMGFMSIQKIDSENFERVIRALNVSKIYLFKAIDFGDAVYSQKASDALLRVLGDSLKHIENIPLDEEEDKLIALKARQEKMKELSHDLQEVVQSILDLRIPGSDAKNDVAPKTFAAVEKINKRLIEIFETPPVQAEKTPEEIKRDSTKREGHIAP